MLETVREYALEQLDEAGELDDVRRAPRARARARSSPAASAACDGARAARDWLDRLDADRENVRAAIAFAVADGDADTALAPVRRAVALLGLARPPDRGRASCWRRRSRSPAGPPSCASARSTAPACSPASRATSRAREALFEESLALARSSATTTARRASSGNLGILALYARDYDEAIARLDAGDGVHARDRLARGLSLMQQTN